MQVYAALALVTLLALVITLAKIKVVEAIEGTPDPLIPTFKPLKQKTDTTIMYTGRCLSNVILSRCLEIRNNYSQEMVLCPKIGIFFIPTEK